MSVPWLLIAWPQGTVCPPQSLAECQAVLQARLWTLAHTLRGCNCVSWAGACAEQYTVLCLHLEGHLTLTLWNVKHATLDLDDRDVCIGLKCSRLVNWAGIRFRMQCLGLYVWPYDFSSILIRLNIS